MRFGYASEVRSLSESVRRIKPHARKLSIQFLASFLQGQMLGKGAVALRPRVSVRFLISRVSVCVPMKVIFSSQVRCLRGV